MRQAQLRLDALPRPGTPLTLDARLLTIFAGLLALLLALLAGLYIRRGDLAAVFGLAPGAVTRRRAKSRAVAPHEEERTALLRQLLALEQARAKGKLDAEAYRREEADHARQAQSAADSDGHSECASSCDERC